VSRGGRRCAGRKGGEAAGEGEGLGELDADEEAADEAGSAGDCDGVYTVEGGGGVLEGAVDGGDDLLEVARLAISGTTPPKRWWMGTWEAMRLERTRRPSMTTEAAVSSQELSMPRMIRGSTPRGYSRSFFRM
jgi:hypothetical protein